MLSTDQHTTGPTILLVDDEPELRHVTARMMASLGYAVIEAEDSAEALIQLARLHGQLDLLVTDLNLAGISGTDLTEWVQNICPTTRVLYITGSAVGDDRDRELLVGGKGRVLGKPFTVEELREALVAVLAE